MINKIRKEYKPKPEKKLTFQGRLIDKINLNLKEDEIKGEQYQNRTEQVGCAWSGIHENKNNNPQNYFFGTENGMIVNFSINISSIQNNNDKEQINSNQQMQMKSEKTLPSKHISSKFRRFEIKKNNSSNLVLVSYHNHSITNNNNNNNNHNSHHEIYIQALKLFDKTQPCYQIGCIDDNIVISGKKNNNYILQIFDKEFNSIFSILNPVSSFQFTRTKSKLLIFREIISFQESPKIIFSKISNNNNNNNQLKILKKITLSKNYFPTSIITNKDFLYVGLYQKIVHVYNIKKGKLMRVIDPQINGYIKKIQIYENIISITSSIDEIVFLHLHGEIIINYTLQNIFKAQKLYFFENYEIYLLKFLTPDIIVIGGSFPFLIFFQWKTGILQQIYKDNDNFIGITEYNDMLYLTHEKSSCISIIQ